MRALRLIRAIAVLARVLEARSPCREAQPIDPALMPVDLAEQGPEGLRLA